MALTPPEKLINGRADHTCDDKNRITLPAKFRALLGEEFVLTMGPHHSIRAYPRPVYDQLAAFVSSRTILDEFDDSSAHLQRLIGNSEIVTLDAQFRVTIPRYLKEWADLSDEAGNAIFGSGSRVEIWSKANWHKYAGDTYTDGSLKLANSSRLTELASESPTGATAA